MPRLPSVVTSIRSKRRRPRARAGRRWAVGARGGTSRPARRRGARREGRRGGAAPSPLGLPRRSRRAAVHGCGCGCTLDEAGARARGGGTVDERRKERRPRVVEVEVASGERKERRPRVVEVEVASGERKNGDLAVRAHLPVARLDVVEPHGEAVGRRVGAHQTDVGAVELQAGVARVQESVPSTPPDGDEFPTAARAQRPKFCTQYLPALPAPMAVEQASRMFRW